MSFGLGFYRSESVFGARIFKWYIKIFKPKSYSNEPWMSWGVSFSKEALHLNWGKHSKLFWMPWDWGGNVRHQVQIGGGKFVDASEVMEGVARCALRKAGYTQHFFDFKLPDQRAFYKYPYTYKLKSGEEQHRVAAFHVEEREWRWRIFHKPYKWGIKLGPARIIRSISIEFDGEVGERTGSWKGGCIGCGYEMKSEESPMDTIKRMEKERKF